jgi:DNA-binding PadR family transcriptional regulator
MGQSHRDPGSYLPLSNLSFHVLLALGDVEATHGYAIGKEVLRRSDGRLDPTTGGLYQALKRLVEDGLIEQTQPDRTGSPDPRRKYFRLTPLGRRVAALEAQRLHGLVSIARERKLFMGPS